MPATRPTSPPLALAVLLLGLTLGGAFDAVLLHQLLKRQHSWVVHAQAVRPQAMTQPGEADCPARPYWGPYHSQHDPHHPRSASRALTI